MELEPGVDDILGPELKELRTKLMALDNAVGQDDHIESWEDTYASVSELEQAVDSLFEATRRQYRQREDGLD